MDVETPIMESPIADFDGPYLATPTEEEQVFEMGNQRAIQNFVVAPIPSNYGLITWDGTVITVS